MDQEEVIRKLKGKKIRVSGEMLRKGDGRSLPGQERIFIYMVEVDSATIVF